MWQSRVLIYYLCLFLPGSEALMYIWSQTKDLGENNQSAYPRVVIIESQRQNLYIASVYEAAQHPVSGVQHFYCQVDCAIDVLALHSGTQPACCDCIEPHCRIAQRRDGGEHRVTQDMPAEETRVFPSCSCITPGAVQIFATNPPEPSQRTFNCPLISYSMFLIRISIETTFTALAK